MLSLSYLPFQSITSIIQGIGKTNYAGHYTKELQLTILQQLLSGFLYLQGHQDQMILVGQAPECSLQFAQLKRQLQ